jgi:hypothetical protein
MSQNPNLHQQLLNDSAELANSPEADFEARECLTMPLTDEDEALAFRLYRDTSSSGGRIETSHKLDFHAFGSRKSLLGVELPHIMNSVCMAWEHPGLPPEMAIRRGFGGQEVQDTVEKLIENGLLTNNTTSKLVQPIQHTLEKFVALHALVDTGVDTTDMAQEAGRTLVTESSDAMNTSEHVGPHRATTRMERYADATYLEVQQVQWPSTPQEPTKTTIKIMQDGKWITYEEPFYLSEIEQKEPVIRVFHSPTLPGGFTKAMICAQVDLELEDDAGLTGMVQRMSELGAFVQPTLVSEQNLPEAPELLVKLVSIINDARDKPNNWANVASSPW